jgi:hypothetical protein
MIIIVGLKHIAVTVKMIIILKNIMHEKGSSMTAFHNLFNMPER